MAKYQHKPTVVEAVKVEDLVSAHHALKAIGAKNVSLSWTPPGLVIETLEGSLRADVGDWVIRGVNGEFYPCKADRFSQLYDEVKPDGEQ